MSFRKATNGLGTQEQAPSKDRGKPWRQILAAIVANLGTVNTGLVFGFSAVAIPQLRAADSLIQINEAQSSWIGKFFV